MFLTNSSKLRWARRLPKYAYVADGLRARKVVDDVATSYVWDGGNIALELAGGAVTARYARGTSLVAGVLGGGTVYYLYNGHGDVVHLTDAAGAVTKVYDYDAFGVEKGIDPDDTNPWRYCGEYFDRETGRIYLRARYYDALVGRFTQQDGWEYGDPDDPLSLNLYTYAHNNPMMYYDPSGHSATAVLFALFGLIALTASTGGIGATMANDSALPGFSFDWGGYRGPLFSGKSDDKPTKTPDELAKLDEKAGYTPAQTIAGSTPASPDPNKDDKKASKITGYTKHGYDQAVGRDGGHGVSNAAMNDAVNNPTQVISQGGGVSKYIGKDAVVILNEMGKVITTWATNSGGWRFP